MPQATRLLSQTFRNDTFGTVLLVACSDRFGNEFLQWDPETIRLEVNDEFQTTISEPNFNKLMAAVRLVTSDAFYKSLPDFIDICNALFSGAVTGIQFDPADAAEVAWGVTEALLIWPPDPQEAEPFAADIVGYIGHVVRAEGIMVPPDVLRLGRIDGEDLWTKVQGQFSDDPRMFAAIYDVEKEKTEEINTLVKDRLRIMLSQLAQLPIAGAQAENMLQQLLQGLQAAQAEGEKTQAVTSVL